MPMLQTFVPVLVLLQGKLLLSACTDSTFLLKLKLRCLAFLNVSVLRRWNFDRHVFAAVLNSKWNAI